MLPNFIIFGAIKGGTTSLRNYLIGHPQIYMSPLKEARYFCYDENDRSHIEKSYKIFPVRSIAEYERLFDGVTNEVAIGEASPQYLRSPIAASRIKIKLPDVKLIASLRNPVDRAYSEYLMAMRSGNEKKAVEEYFQSHDKLKFSCYYENIKRFYDQFSKDQIQIVLLEDLKSDASSVVAKIFDFLELDTTYYPDFSRQYNVGGLPKSKWLYHMLQVKNKKLKLAVKPFVPECLLTLRTKVKNINMKPAPPLSEELRGRLNIYFREDVSRLEDLLKMDLSCWKVSA